MPITIDVLVDTNILLRTQFDKNTHVTGASRAFVDLRRRGERLATTVQNLAEFWNVSTRPESANGHGLTGAETLTRLQYFERAFTILPESSQSYTIWKQLIVTHDIRGKIVHDTRLVSVMMSFGIGKILTFNMRTLPVFRRSRQSTHIKCSMGPDGRCSSLALTFCIEPPPRDKLPI
jgi:predicted nucleic acid-binding protein